MIELTYHQATMAVDALLPMHVLWLPQRFDSGYFMVAGRQELRVGEVILAKDLVRLALGELLAAHPIQVVAHYWVLPLMLARTGPKLAWLICHTATE